MWAVRHWIGDQVERGWRGYTAIKFRDFTAKGKPCPSLANAVIAAHTVLGHDVDHAEFGARLLPALQHLHFPLAPNESTETPAYGRFKPCGLNTDSVEPIDLLWLGLALDCTLASEARCVAALMNTEFGSA